MNHSLINLSLDFFYRNVFYMHQHAKFLNYFFICFHMRLHVFILYIRNTADVCQLGD